LCGPAQRRERGRSREMERSRAPAPVHRIGCACVASVATSRTSGRESVAARVLYYVLLRFRAKLRARDGRIFAEMALWGVPVGSLRCCRVVGRPHLPSSDRGRPLSRATRGMDCGRGLLPHQPILLDVVGDLGQLSGREIADPYLDLVSAEQTVGAELKRSEGGDLVSPRRPYRLARPYIPGDTADPSPPVGGGGRASSAQGRGRTCPSCCTRRG
jgi:hypothetical protein